MSLINSNILSLYNTSTIVNTLHYVPEMCPVVPSHNLSLKKYPHLVKILKYVNQGHWFHDAFLKKEGYCSRLFSNETWDEWTEQRTALGRAVDYLQHSSYGKKMGPLFKQANQEAKALIKTFEEVDLTPECWTQQSEGSFKPIFNSDEECWKKPYGSDRSNWASKDEFYLDRPPLSSKWQLEFPWPTVLFSKEERVEQIRLNRRFHSTSNETGCNRIKLPSENAGCPNHYQIYESHKTLFDERIEQLIIERRTQLNACLMLENLTPADTLISKLFTAAQSMEIEIENQGNSSVPWLSIDKLKKYLLNQEFTQNQKLNYEQFSLTVTEIDNRKFIDSTQLEVKADEIYLIDSEVPYPIQKLSLQVMKMWGPSLLSRVKLEEKIRDIFNYYVFENQSVNITIDNIGLQVMTKNRKFHYYSRGIEYGVAGKILDSTKIEFELIDPLTFHKELDLNPLYNVVGGLSSQFDKIVREVMLSRGPLREEFARRGIRPVKGMLLWGPRGTGKTTIARNLGAVLGCEGERYQLLTGSELIDKYVGETDKKIRELFRPAEEAKKKGSQELYIIAIDEADSLLPRRVADSYRNSWVNQMLGKLDGFDQLDNIFVILLTNRPEMIDPAILRPGRIELHLEIPLPDAKGREEIFAIHTKILKQANILEEIDLAALAAETEGSSGADIEGIVKKASSYSLMRLYDEKIPQKDIETHPSGKVTMKDFRRAIKEM